MNIYQNGSIFFCLKPSNPFAFYLAFLSERFWHITYNPQIISTRCTQNANSFFSCTQHAPSISHFSVVASLVFTPLNGLWNEGDHKRCRYQGGQICQNANKRHIKRKEKRGGAPNFTQRIIDSEKKTSFLAGFVRPFFGYKMAPTGAREPKTSLKFRR